MMSIADIACALGDTAHGVLGVRELKAKLSEYLERVASGQILTITVRGRRVAQLVPVAGAALERGLAEGWIPVLGC